LSFCEVTNTQHEPPARRSILAPNAIILVNRVKLPQLTQIALEGQIDVYTGHMSFGLGFVS